MLSDLKTLAAILNSLHEQYIATAAPKVQTLIDSGSRDVWLIEHTLDRLLDSACLPAGLALYKRLCRHYYTIDQEAAVYYVDAYREMWDEESISSRGSNGE